MKTNRKSILNLAGVGALAAVMATSAFAAPQRGNDRGNQQYHNSYRENQRLSASGKVTSFSRENGGYRVQLDNGRDWYWVPDARMSNRGTDLRVGLTLSFGGIYRGGRIEVDAVTWPDNRGYGNDRGNRNDTIRGTVERVDLRAGTLLLRDSSSRRTIAVDMRDTRRSSRVDLRDLHRGDVVTISGDWRRNGHFEADRIDSVRTRR
jgi:hypothetical protein